MAREQGLAGPRIYLDHAATTPMLPEARAAMIDGFARWANPSSPHAEGRAARAALENARARIKAALGWNGELIFTSGASEAIEIAMTRAKAAGRLISAVEHDAVRRAAPDATVIPVLGDGRLDPEQLGPAFRNSALPLVAVQHVNSETGVVQPIGAIGQVVEMAKGLLLVDCAQSAGRLPLPKADMIAVSAHKLGGPPGIGALLVRDFGMLEPSGGQEFGYRGGTENLPAALGFAAAVEAGELTEEGMQTWAANHYRHRFLLDMAVEQEGGCAICGPSLRSPLVASYLMPGMDAAAQLIRFDSAGFAVSAGSACSSGSLKLSHVMTALRLQPDEARQVIRVSFGRDTTRGQVERFAAEWQAMAREARKRAA